MRAASIALALLVSLPAAAECKKEEFNRYLAVAVRLYEGLEYERALDQLGKARDNSCGVEDDARLGLYEGIVRSDLGEAEKAKAAFKEALLLKPDAEIPLKVSPKVKKLVESLRAEAKKELAPILAKQEEERRKKIAEENERERLRRDEENRRTEELRRAAENAKTDEQRRVALEEMRRLDEQRRADEARRAAERPARPPDDRPEARELTATVPRTNDEPLAAVQIEQKQKRGVPVVSIVFAGAGVIAGGIGAYFGVTARNHGAQARAKLDDQVERERLMNLANTNAIIADVLFAVAGAAALCALIALFAIPSESSR